MNKKGFSLGLVLSALCIASCDMGAFKVPEPEEALDVVMKEVIAEPMLLDALEVTTERDYQYYLISSDRAISYSYGFRVYSNSSIGGHGEYVVKQWRSADGYLVDGSFEVDFTGRSVYNENIARPPTLVLTRDFKGTVQIGGGGLDFGIKLTPDGVMEGSYYWCGKSHSTYHASGY